MPDSALDPKKIDAPTRFRAPLTSPEAAQWRISFWRNVSDFLAAPARSPRIASSVATSTLTWPAAGHLTRAQTFSLLFHGSLIVLLLIPATVPPPGRPEPNSGPLVFPAWEPPPIRRGQAKKDTGGGGSGARDKNPARSGAIPPFARWQFTPANDNVERKRVMAPPTLVGPDFTHSPMVLPFGDSRWNGATNSRGPGSGGSYGDGDGTGDGPGKGPGSGPGQGGWQGGDRGIREGGKKGAGMPVCIYCPNPTFTQEAIAVKYQGEVTLRLIVTEEGKPINVSITRSAGLGLDERALEAVKTWRFQPARGANGRPEAVWVTVEVMFRQF